MVTTGNNKDAARQCDELTTAAAKHAAAGFPFPNLSWLYPPTPEIGKCVMAGDMGINIHSSQAEKEASPVALRFNEGKVRWDLIDPTAVEGVAKVLDFGTNKYTAENWRKGLSWKSTLRSLESHLQALKRGEDLDPESGLPHIDHLGCNWMFFSNYQKTGAGTDDRVKSKSVQEHSDKLLLERQDDWLAQRRGIER